MAISKLGHPIVNRLNAPFWSAADEGRLSLPHCVVTGQPFWPPSPSSPFQAAGPVEWREIDPQGMIRSIIIFQRAFQPELVSHLPYGIMLVEVAEGVRLSIFSSDPTAAQPGEIVRIRFATFGEGGHQLPIADGEPLL